MTRECGTCTMCCKLLDVDSPHGLKPADQWCRHCQPGKGCAIYATRWDACREFLCGWLQNPMLPDELRPDRCHVILTSNLDGGVTAICSPDRPEAWRAPIMLALLHHLARNDIFVAVNCGKRKWLIGAERVSEVPAANIGADNEIAIPSAVAVRLRLGRRGLYTKKTAAPVEGAAGSGGCKQING
jgi:hypothetical protein